ncbi:phosphoglycerate dehydrogenase, partial [Rhizobium ruizarguesonis]
EKKERGEKKGKGGEKGRRTQQRGGATEEAQERIGREVSRKLVEYSDIGATLGAVNFPQGQLPPRPNGTRFIHVHEN